VNPIIYCFINDSFQRSMLRTLMCRCLATTRTPSGVGDAAWRGASATGGGARGRRGSGGGAAAVELRAINGGAATPNQAVTTAVTGSGTSSTAVKTVTELRSTFV